MKTCVVLFLALYGAFATNVTLTEIHKLWKEQVAEFLTECICQTSVKQDIVDGFYNSAKMPDDPCFKCFLRCIGYKMEVFSPTTGEFDVNKWDTRFVYVDLPLAQKCARFVEPDPCEKVYLGVKCVNDDLAERYAP